MSEVAEHNGVGAHGGRQLTVLVAVASQLNRYGLRTMLADLPFVHGVDTCAELGEVGTLLSSGRFTVLLMSMPSSTVLERHLATAAAYGVKTVLLLPNLDDELVTAVAALPVDGFLVEGDVNMASLSRTFAQLCSGEIQIPDSLARTLLSRLRRIESRPGSRDFLLTAREQEALRLLAQGLSNKQIAARMRISVHGAKRHVTNVMAKLNCPNRTLAVALGLHHGLLRDPVADQVE